MRQEAGLRFFILVAAAAGIGAGSIFAFKTMLPEQDASIASAVRSMTASAAQFRLSDLNPIRSAYDEVTTKVTSSDPNAFNFRAAPPIVIGEPLKLPNPVDLGAIGGGANFQYRRR
jgi:hypothetical protein